MKFIIKIFTIITIAVLLVSSIYIGFFIKEDNDKKEKDSEPPTIDSITGDMTITQGKIATISTTFSDNFNVTKATIYYKSENDESWTNKSILSQSVDILIPSNSKENWYYYVTVDDEEENGPVGSPSTDGSLYYTITAKEKIVDLAHTVFMEEGTATWCKNCPEIAEALHEHFYESNDGHFYYVSMIDDYEKASEYLHDHYNILGFPTVFIDGGYKVILGSTDFDTSLAEKCCMDNMSSAAHRNVPELYINVTAEIDENKDKMDVNVLIENYENEIYTGHLKVYLTEIISRWTNFEGKPYHFGFLDFIINKEITISGKENTNEKRTWDISDLDPENLMIIAVIFNSESRQAYANPPNGNPFDAYYADQADAARVTEGKLPPSIGINIPKKYSHYIWGKEKYNMLLKKTYIIGKIPIKVNVEAESGIEKVEYTIKGPLRKIKETITEEPYTWTWKKIAFGKYTITAKIYDKDGRTATDSIEVYAFMLGLF